MRILVVEDDAQVSDSLKASLETETFFVDVAADGDRGVLMSKNSDYDLVILDYILPGIDGGEVCRQLRDQGLYTPILMLTIKGETCDKVSCLDLGADDYLTKPFSMDELRARVRALTRRPQKIAEDTLKIDDLVFDVKRHLIMRGDKEVYLTKKESMLLEYLMRHQGTVMRRQTLLDHIWGSDIDPLTNSIEMHIMSLRKKIDTRAKKKLIHTIPGRGYALDVR